jgi:hypothetical protein
MYCRGLESHGVLALASFPLGHLHSGRNAWRPTVAAGPDYSTADSKRNVSDATPRDCRLLGREQK